MRTGKAPIRKTGKANRKETRTSGKTITPQSIATAFLGILGTPVVGYAGLVLGRRIGKILSTKRTET